MKCLITGGSGFIGSHIVDLLIEKNYEVIVVDKDLKNTNPKAKYYETDITNYETLKKIFEKEQPDLVNHQAAHVSVPNSVKNPTHDAQTNIIGTLNILRLSKEHNVKNFVYASTCAVYGNPKTIPVTETHKLQPESPYGVSKLTCEYYIPLFVKNYVILRYSNVYGPRQPPKGMIIPTFMQKIKNKQPVTIFGDGNQIRDYIYVGDIAQANLKALESRKKIRINVGTKQGTSVNEIFNILSELLEYQLKPNYESERKGDVQKVILDNSKLLHEFNYTPKTTLKQGIEKTILKS
ncbi:MAG: NAD-dependent epimerase/dehydratase family protein [Nanoarchaeota archaeon]|nr:NAD-dependent epimerase/dehydratase family protein [Nanoarchaeota archaeon]